MASRATFGKVDSATAVETTGSFGGSSTSYNSVTPQLVSGVASSSPNAHMELAASAAFTVVLV